MARAESEAWANAVKAWASGDGSDSADLRFHHEQDASEHEFSLTRFDRPERGAPSCWQIYLSSRTMCSPIDSRVRLMRMAAAWVRFGGCRRLGARVVSSGPVTRS